MINKSILILIIFFVFFQIDQVLSEESNNFSMEQNEPYEIIAENMFIEREQNVVGFSGNVVLKQGFANLKADQILLFFNENIDQEDFYKMEASGNILIRNNEATSITGNSAAYNVDDNKLIMTENVVLKNQLSMINGNKLILDINSGKIEIFDDKLDQVRVKGVLVDQEDDKE
jgi:lipopolysaccharide transport protein LptA